MAAMLRRRRLSLVSAGRWEPALTPSCKGPRRCVSPGAGSKRGGSGLARGPGRRRRRAARRPGSQGWRAGPAAGRPRGLAGAAAAQAAACKPAAAFAVHATTTTAAATAPTAPAAAFSTAPTPPPRDTAPHPARPRAGWAACPPGPHAWRRAAPPSGPRGWRRPRRPGALRLAQQAQRVVVAAARHQQRGQAQGAGGGVAGGSAVAGLGLRADGHHARHRQGLTRGPGPARFARRSRSPPPPRGCQSHSPAGNWVHQSGSSTVAATVAPRLRAVVQPSQLRKLPVRASSERQAFRSSSSGCSDTTA